MLHGYRTELSVMPIGIFSGCKKDYSETISDFNMFYQNDGFIISHLKNCKISETNRSRNISRDAEILLVVLANKRNGVAAESFKLIDAKKYYRCSPFSAADREFNKKLSQN